MSLKFKLLVGIELKINGLWKIQNSVGLAQMDPKMGFKNIGWKIDFATSAVIACALIAYF